MLISTETGAGQIVPTGDDIQFFDDIGCLAAEYRSGNLAYVRAGTEWIDVHAAFFARPQAIRTAMGSGFAAFATSSEARTADAGGRAMTWDDVVRSKGGVR